MSEENVNIMRQGYDAFNRGDIDTVMGLFDPNIEWQELEVEGLPLRNQGQAAGHAGVPPVRVGYARCPRPHLLVGVVRPVHRADGLVEEPDDRGSVARLVGPDPRPSEHIQQFSVASYVALPRPAFWLNEGAPGC